MTKKKIEELAESIYLQLGGFLPVDVIKAAALYGLEVFVSDLEKLAGERPSGILAQFEGTWAIYINSNDSFTRQRFSIAHELGHFLLHKGKQFVDEFSAGETFYRDGDSTKEEKEANSFAASILMPASVLEQLWPTFRDPLHAAEYFEVSEVSMTYRLKNLGLIHIEE